MASYSVSARIIDNSTIHIEAIMTHLFFFNNIFRDAAIKILCIQFSYGAYLQKVYRCWLFSLICYQYAFQLTGCLLLPPYNIIRQINLFGKALSFHSSYNKQILTALFLSLYFKILFMFNESSVWTKLSLSITKRKSIFCCQDLRWMVSRFGYLSTILIVLIFNKKKITGVFYVSLKVEMMMVHYIRLEKHFVSSFICLWILDDLITVGYWFLQTMFNSLSLAREGTVQIR